MDFFDHIRNIIAFFQIFGLWSSWQNCRYNFLLQIYSILLTSSVLFAYSPLILKHFVLDSLFDTLLILFSTSAALTLVIITFETVSKSSIQSELFQQFAIVDRMFQTESSLYIPYGKEKRDILVRFGSLVSILLAAMGLSVTYIAAHPDELSLMFFLFYSKWIMHLKSIQVVIFVYLVRARLILVNKEIVRIQAR